MIKILIHFTTFIGSIASVIALILANKRKGEKLMRVYIIHSSDKEENYIDRVVATEEKLIEEGHHVMNRIPEDGININNKKMHSMYGNLIPYCDMVYAMEGWDKTSVSNKEMAEAMLERKTITFEQKV